METQQLIAEICIKHGKSLKEIAKILDYNYTTIWRYSRGELKPRKPVINALEALLNKRCKPTKP